MDARRSAIAVPLLAAAVLTAFPVAAGAGGRTRDFGANLNRAPNNTASCQSLQLFVRVASCSFSTSGSIRSSRESMLVPGTGTVTRVRVRVGPRTGPMRLTVAQALRKENGGEAACCTGRRQSRVFTPRANRTTSVTVNFPVSVTFNRVSRIHAFDVLFLTMENPNTPIPANVVADTTNGNCSGGWFPALRPRVENFTGPYGVCGATILARGTWRPR
jgi:hypothetical protein